MMSSMTSSIWNITQVNMFKWDYDQKEDKQKCRRGDLTSFSQLELRVSKAIGLLGALLPGPGGMPPWSEDWLGQGKLNAWEPSFPRYRFTCCCCERWMWYLVGFSKWVWTYEWRAEKKDMRRRQKRKELLKIIKSASATWDLKRHFSW